MILITLPDLYLFLFILFLFIEQCNITRFLIPPHFILNFIFKKTVHMVWHVASWCIIVPSGQSSMITSMRLANLIAEYFYIFIKASYMGVEVHIAFKFFM